MATLRKYSSFETKRRSRILTAKKALLGITCLFTGIAVFTSVNALKPDGKPSILAGVNVPVVDKIARLWQTPPRKSAISQRPIIVAPAYIAGTASKQHNPANITRENIAREMARLAAKRRAEANGLIDQRHNVDRTPVASIPGNTGGFRELQTSPSAPGFRQISR